MKIHPHRTRARCEPRESDHYFISSGNSKYDNLYNLLDVLPIDTVTGLKVPAISDV
jgi:hypothetical protein